MEDSFRPLIRGFFFYIALIPDVFSRVIDAINQNTVPYNPNLLNIKDFATSEITDKVTDPTG